MSAERFGTRGEVGCCRGKDGGEGSSKWAVRSGNFVYWDPAKTGFLGVCAHGIERFVEDTFDAGHIQCGLFAAYLGDCDCEKENAGDQKVAGVGEVAADELVWPVVTVPLLPALFEGGKKKTRVRNTESE